MIYRTGTHDQEELRTQAFSCGPQISETEPQMPENNRKVLRTSRSLLPSLRKSLTRTVAASVDDVRSQCPGPGGVTDVSVRLRTANVQKEPQMFADGRKRSEGTTNARNKPQMLYTNRKRSEGTANAQNRLQMLYTDYKRSGRIVYICKGATFLGELPF